MPITCQYLYIQEILMELSRKLGANSELGGGGKTASDRWWGWHPFHSRMTLIQHCDQLFLRLYIVLHATCLLLLVTQLVHVIPNTLDAHFCDSYTSRHPYILIMQCTFYWSVLSSSSWPAHGTWQHFLLDTHNLYVVSLPCSPYFSLLIVVCSCTIRNSGWSKYKCVCARACVCVHARACVCVRVIVCARVCR